ncbi:MAG: Fur family transcriptional regulator [Marinicellaceae bacterium]
MTNKTMVANLINKAETKCISLGLKLTTKRKLILQQLLETGSLMSAYDILDRLKSKQKENIPAMSIYRILGFLEESNLVHKLESQKKFVACRHIKCDHRHQSAQFLICQECDYFKEINLEDSVMNDISANANLENFKLEYSVIEFKGLCPNCQSEIH